MSDISIALLFSGGRDSLVLLHILEPWLGEIVIVWVNTGAAYESTLKQMAEVRNAVPHFVELTSNQAADIEKWGWPVDIVPVKHDWNQQGNLTPKLQSSTLCCYKNISTPIETFLNEKGIKVCYVGQRQDEGNVDQRWDGQRQGIEFRYPLRKWTKKMVMDYVSKHNVKTPHYYSTEEKSRDCWNCTGFLSERRVAISNLSFYQRQEVLDRLSAIKNAINGDMENLVKLTAPPQKERGVSPPPIAD